MSTKKLTSFLSSRQKAHQTIPLVDQNLFTAVHDSDLPGISTALARGASPDAREYGAIDDLTPLMIAARDGDHAVCSALLAAKANPNLTDFKGWSPLHFAAFNADDACYKALLAHGANESLTNKDGATPASLVQFSRPLAPRR